MSREELDAATDEQLNAMAAPIVGLVPFPYLIPSTPPYRFCPKKEVHISTARLWSPATDIADAWELPPKLEPEWLVTVTRRTGDVGEWFQKLRYHVEFRRIGESEPRYICYAHEDQARAITTAALLAWEAKEKA